MTRNDLHILILSSWYPTEDHPYLGNFVERQADLLGQRYQVTLLHTSAQSEPGIIVHENQKPNFREIHVNFKRGSKLNKVIREMKAFQHGLKMIENVDLIIGNVLIPKGWSFTRAQTKFRCPLFYVEHGSFFRPEKVDILDGKYKLILNNVRKKAKVVIAVSEVLKYNMVPFFPKHEIKVLGNHVDTALFYPKPKEKKEATHFLHISTLDKATKNPAGLFKAFELLKKETDGFKLTVISDEDYSEWKQWAEEKGMSNVIEFQGPLRWDELLPYYHNADAFILFSEFESFSIVLAEAMSTGTPVVTTPVGIAANLPKELGLIAKPSDPENLKDQLLSIVNNQVQFDTEAIINESSKYSETTILNEWEKLISLHVN